jgi:hypothetical protein
MSKLRSVAPALLLALVSFSFAEKDNGREDMPAWISVDIGHPKAGNTSIVNDGKGVKLQGYGTMFGMHLSADQGRFAYTKMKADFDIIIQVENISSSTNAFAEGGLMVRKDLNPEGLMLANFVTNNNYKGECDQYTFMFRTVEAGSIEPYWTIIDGFYGERARGNLRFGYSARGWNKTNTPDRPFPYVWLRIMRKGNLYMGYRSVGDKDPHSFVWEKMSEIQLDLGEEPLVGIALSANHHHPTIYGKIGDPESMSEMLVSKLTGFR